VRPFGRRRPAAMRRRRGRLQGGSSRVRTGTALQRHGSLAGLAVPRADSPPAPLATLPFPQAKQPQMGQMLHQLRSSLAQFAESEEVAAILKQMLQVRLPPAPCAPRARAPVSVYMPCVCARAPERACGGSVLAVDPSPCWPARAAAAPAPPTCAFNVARGVLGRAVR
jgi:hypothetical protein